MLTNHKAGQTLTVLSVFDETCAPPECDKSQPVVTVMVGEESPKSSAVGDLYTKYWNKYGSKWRSHYMAQFYVTDCHGHRGNGVIVEWHTPGDGSTSDFLKFQRVDFAACGGMTLHFFDYVPVKLSAAQFGS